MKISACFFLPIALMAQATGYGRTNTTHNLLTLGSAYENLGRISEAEKTYKAAIAVDPGAVEPINSLALLYFETGRNGKAEKLTRRCLAIDQKNAADPLVIARDLGNLGAVYQSQHRYWKAEEFFLKSIDMFESHGGANTSGLAFVLHNLGSLRFERGQAQDAARYVERALSIWESTLGSDNPVYAQGLAHLAYLYAKTGRADESEKLWKQSLVILETTVGMDHPTYARLWRAYRRSQSATDRYTVDYRALFRH